MTRGTTIPAVVAALLIAACGSAESTSGGHDAGQQELDDVIELTLDADGAERGSGATGPDGVVRFYSHRHDALFSIALGNDDDDALAGIVVHMQATEEGASYYADDPAGDYMPLLFQSGIPTELDQELTVSGEEIFLEGGDIFEFEPGDDPFTSRLLVGFTVSLSVRGVMMAVGKAAALMVFKKLVQETCLFFAPLHDDVCKVVANVVDFGRGVVVKGIKLVARKGYSWIGGLATATLQEAWSELRSKACEAGGKFLITWIVPPEDEQEKPVQLRYREVAYKYRYLLDKLDNDPPDDPTARAALVTELGAAGKALTGVAGKVRDHYFELYNDNPETFLTDASFKLTAEAIKELVEFRPLILESITLAYGYEELLLITDTTVYFESYEFFYGEIEISEGPPIESPWLFDWGVDCALTAAKGARIGWTAQDEQWTADIEIETAAGFMIDIIDDFLAKLHAEHWGGDIPDPDCLPDIWEPNDTWQSALTQPFANAGSPVTIENFNLCDGTSADDVDWIAIDANLINFQVQGRIRAPEGGEGANERVCLDLYWYSQITELAGDPPYFLTGACGTVASEFSTAQIGVAQSTGESFRYVLARVRPDPGVPIPSVGIDYTLGLSY
jgi:hypothetical protein